MSFAPYQPPPDLPPADDGPSNKKKSGPKRPWFSRDASSYSTGGGYQSGASSSQAHTNYSSSSAPVLPTHAGPSTGQGEGGAANSWETRFGWRVDFEAAGAYVLGPISALILLILETHNDYARFHGYQSALLTTPLLLLHFLLNLIFPRWLSIISTLLEIALVAFMAFRAYTDANRGLERFYLPVIGELAERWVGDE